MKELNRTRRLFIFTVLIKESEPIFVRIDKFEDSLEMFEKIKDRIQDINNLLLEVKQIKKEEEQQLSLWEKEMQGVKDEVSKIDQELFSKL